MTYDESVIQLIREYSCKRIAEIGVLRAVLAEAVHKACPLDAYYLIDPWKPFSGIGAGVLADIAHWDDMCFWIYRYFWKHEEVRIIRLESVQAAALFKPESLDLVFIDADHAYEAVKQDVGAWWPVVRMGGIISGHDYGIYLGVAKAVHECFEEVQRLPGSVWYVEKHE